MREAFAWNTAASLLVRRWLMKTLFLCHARSVAVAVAQSTVGGFLPLRSRTRNARRAWRNVTSSMTPPTMTSPTMTSPTTSPKTVAGCGEQISRPFPKQTKVSSDVTGDGVIDDVTGYDLAGQLSECKERDCLRTFRVLGEVRPDNMLSMTSSVTSGMTLSMTSLLTTPGDVTDDGVTIGNYFSDDVVEDESTGRRRTWRWRHWWRHRRWRHRRRPVGSSTRRRLPAVVHGERKNSLKKFRSDDRRAAELTGPTEVAAKWTTRRQLELGGDNSSDGACRADHGDHDGLFTGLLWPTCSNWRCDSAVSVGTSFRMTRV